MSVVTNVILHYSIMEDEYPEGPLAELNKSLEGTDRWTVFIPIDYEAGGRAACTGTKALETNICIGAFNHLDLSWMIEKVRLAPWDYPEYVQLFVMEDGDNVFTERLQGRNVVALG